MKEDKVPNPKYALGVDKAGFELLDKVRNKARGMGVEIGQPSYDQNRHYVYPVRGPKRTVYVFFDWYADGTAWYATTPYETGTRFLRSELKYDQESKTFKAAGQGAAVEDVFAAGVKAIAAD